jgi:hypothetical protein
LVFTKGVLSLSLSLPSLWHANKAPSRDLPISHSHHGTYRFFVPLESCSLCCYLNCMISQITISQYIQCGLLCSFYFTLLQSTSIYVFHTNALRIPLSSKLVCIGSTLAYIHIVHNIGISTYTVLSTHTSNCEKNLKTKT